MCLRVRSKADKKADSCVVNFWSVAIRLRKWKSLREDVEQRVMMTVNRMPD